MLLRIDIPPPPQSSSSSITSSVPTPRAGNTAAPPPPPIGTTSFYACPATAFHHDDDDGNTNGTLVTVGRKNTDVTFASERSVSRSHCTLRLIGTNGGAPCGVEEVEACEASVDGMAIVLDDLNSKFGTFYYTDNTPQKRNKNNDDSETDETDDDDNVGMLSTVGQQSQLSTNAATVPEWIQNKIRKRVQNKIILHSLSISSTSSSLSTTIQCGNAILNITRIPLTICTSQLRSAETKRLRQASPTIGATITSSIVTTTTSNTTTTTTTHLIAPTRISTAKSIYAWMYQIPVVTMSYIDALAARTTLTDPMPGVEEHTPPGTLPMDALGDALTQNPTAPQTCLREYKILSLEDSDGEMLCRGAGATIRKLYKHDQQTNGAYWKKDEWWKGLEEEWTNDKLCVVWLTCSTKNKQKRNQEYLTKLMKKQEDLADGDGEQFRIGSTNQAKVAKAITSLSVVLEDVKGVELRTIRSLESASDDDQNVVGMDVDDEIDKDLHHNDNENENDNDNSIDNINDNDNNDNFVDLSCPDAIKEDHPTTHETQTTNSQRTSTSKRSRRSQQQSNAIKEDHPTTHETQTDSQRTSTSKRSRRSQQQSNNTAGDWMLSSQMDTKGTKKSSQQIKQDDDNNEEEKSAPPPSPTTTNTNRASASSSSGWKHKLKAAEGGWLVAAPQGKKRAKYRRPAAELARNGEAPLKLSAQTDHCQTLIVRQLPTPTITTTTTATTTGGGGRRRKTKRKDYKRFQKNSVLTGARMHSLSQIRLRAVLPKESERQRQLASSEKELEREQRAADSLFAGGGGGGGEVGGSRRGKGGSSSLRNYFQASPAKRGTTGRRRRA